MGAQIVSVSEFLRNFVRYREEVVATKMITLTSRGRPVGAFLSPSEAAHYEQLRRRDRQSLVVGDLAVDVVEAIEAAVYGTGPD